MIIGERIKHFRKLSGFSLKEMEKRTGIKKEYLCRIETKALPNPTYKTIQIIAQGLGINLTKLFEPSAPTPPPKLSLLSPKELPVAPSTRSLVAIPIVNQQSLCRPPHNLSSEEIEDYVMIGSSFIPNITKNGTYRATYLDENDNGMYPAIPAGALVCIDMGQKEIPQLIDKIVLIKDSETTCKARYLKIQENFIVGLPHDGHHYNPLVIPQQEENPILGKVIGCFPPPNRA
jgi:transcriptional regulator with XRE-family HTH domain